MVLRPLPVGAAIERVGEGADLMFFGRICVKEHTSRQRARQQKSAVYRRQLALPGTPAGLHVEKMIIKTMVAGRVGFGTVRTIPEKPQCRKRTLDRGGTRHESALNAHRVTRQREASGGNTGRPIRCGLVDHQPVDWIRLVHIVAESCVLQLFQFGFSG